MKNYSNFNYFLLYLKYLDLFRLLTKIDNWLYQPNSKMEVTKEYTVAFIERLWYNMGAKIIDKICSEYEISEEIKAVLYQQYLKPNDWQLRVPPSS
jgi:hypothetical protein